MTTRPQSQCGACARYRSPFSAENTAGLEGPFCAAFPGGIPDRIYNNELDHRQPIDGDHGLRWEARDGAAFPTYAFAAEALGEGIVVAASEPGGPHTGAMITLIPAAADAESLAVEFGEPVDQLHCTLLFLGEADQIEADRRAAMVEICQTIAAGWGEIEAEGFSLAVFNPLGDEPCIVLGLTGVALADFHDDLTAELEADVEQHQPWQPHITLVYTDDVSLIGDLVDRIGPVVFDRLRVVFADQVTDIPLSGDQEPDDDDEPVTAARVRWNGCPRCFAPVHDGPCDAVAG